MARPKADTEIPVSVRLRAVYGFVDEYGDRWHWDAGQIVRNPFVIDMLVDREAPIETLAKRDLPREENEE